MMNPNSILALDQLPFDVVHKLACSSNALAARHLHPISRWPWSKQRHLLNCDVCAYTFDGLKPQHAAWCHVGRTQEIAQEIIKFTAQPLPKHMRTPQPGLRITEVPQQIPQERSDGQERRRMDGGSSGATLPAASDYEEPWAWDPQHRAVVDKHGLVVADLFRGTDLTVEAQEQTGRRIVACVNFLAGNSNEWLQDARLKVADSMMGEREEIDGIVLDLGALGWYVEELGHHLDFPDYSGAKVYFNTRVHIARELARRRASAPCNGVRA